MTPAPRLAPGVTLADGGLRIVSYLGEGGGRANHLAIDVETGADRLVTVLSPDVAATPRLRRTFAEVAAPGLRVGEGPASEVLASGVDEHTGAPWFSAAWDAANEAAALKAFTSLEAGAAADEERGGATARTVLLLVAGLVAVGGLAIALLFVWASNFTDIRIADVAKGGIALTAATLALADALGRALRLRVPRIVVTALFGALALGAFVAYFDGFQFGYPKYYHRWEQYHTYVGGKYFPELGYDRLYACAVVAEDELGTVTVDPTTSKEPQVDLTAEVRRPAKTIRDLPGNQGIIHVTGILAHPEDCIFYFSPERWAAFKADVLFFRSQSDKGYWEDMQRDHGFHMTPGWMIAGRALASLHGATVGWQQGLSLIDPLLWVLMFAALSWAFGLRVGAVAVILWGCQAIAPFFWTGGAFLRQDWLFLLVLAGCLARKRRFALAGAALVYASMIAVFPAYFAIGWLVVIAAAFYRRRRLAPEHRRLLLGAAIAAGVLFAASVFVAGLGAWPEYFHRAAVADATPLTNHMGLRAFVSHDIGGTGRMEFSRDRTLIDPFRIWKQLRNERWERWWLLATAFGLAVLAAFVAVVRRYRLLWVAHALGALLVVLFTQLVCFFYPFLILTAPLTRLRRGLEVVLFSFAALTQVLAVGLVWNDDKYAWLSASTILLGLILLVACRRPKAKGRARRRRRRRAKRPQGHETPAAA